jgi:formate/nitrite transporter FocA (FNT family)
MLLHWFVTFWGNLAGSLFVVAIIFGCTYHSYTSCPCPSSLHIPIHQEQPLTIHLL